MFRALSHFPAFRRLAALIALVALLTPSVAGLLHHPAASSSAMLSMPSCAMMGMSMGPESAKDSQKEQTPIHKQPVCPICQSLHLLAGGFVPPALPALLFVVAPSLAVFAFIFLAGSVRRIGAPQARPRAPPVFRV